MRTTSLMIAALVAMAGTCSGQICDWNVANGNWNAATNWSPQIIPDAPGESARLAVAGVYTVTMDMSPTIDWLEISNLDATLDLRGNVLTLLDAGGLVNDGTITNYATSMIHGNITNNGLISLPASNWTLVLSGPTVTNEGMIIVNPGHSGYFADLLFGADTTLEGDGVVQLDHSTAYLSTGSNMTLTQALGHRIEGSGEVRAALVNNGVVEANMPGAEMVATTYNKVNNNVMKASGGGVLRVRATAIDQTGGGTLLAEEASAIKLDDAIILGGTLETVGTGLVETRDGHSTLTGVTNNGLLNLLAANWTASVAGTGMTNNGHVVVNSNDSGYFARIYITEDATIDGAGALTLMRNSAWIETAAGITGTIGPDQTIGGVGTVNGAFVFHGTISPGLSVGSLNVQGTIDMMTEAALDIEISSTGSHDKTVGSADYNLNGMVRVAFVDDYAPAFGDQFWIVNGGSVEGEFHTIAGPVLPGELVYKVRYEPTAAVLVITCPADGNADAVVDTQDFLWFLNLWVAGDPEADWNDDGSVDTLDFLAYLNEWCRVVDACDDTRVTANTRSLSAQHSEPRTSVRGSCHVMGERPSY